jgi:hypothetical protein
MFLFTLNVFYPTRSITQTNDLIDNSSFSWNRRNKNNEDKRNIFLYIFYFESIKNLLQNYYKDVFILYFYPRFFY